MDEAGAASSAQLLSPIGMQLVLTPIHLLALNIYNEPKAALAERAQQAGRTRSRSRARARSRTLTLILTLTRTRTLTLSRWGASCPPPRSRAWAASAARTAWAA